MKRSFFSLFLICLVSCKGIPPTPKGPVVKEPVFSITSIKILQAELINTRLKVHIRVENPNNFPVELLSFTYELYGSGRLWADGTEKNACTIPASGFLEKDLYLVMNFINMRRDLLDRIIAMRTVRYRFTGTAELSAEALPAFTHAFNLEGESEVEQ
jgi:LEA14-like dessication related protein